MAEQLAANSRQFTFELVAPEKIEVSGMEERVILPGEMGDFMVLAGHELLLAGLRPGLVSVFRNNQIIRYFIEGGFADIGNFHCTIMTPHVMPVDRLNIESLNDDLDKIEKQIAVEANSATRARLIRESDILREKADIAQKYTS